MPATGTKTHVHGVQYGGQNPKDVPVVCEYPDLFPEELPRMPPDRDIEFIINLLPGTIPIAKRPYRMATDELKELKEKLREL